MRDPAAIRDDIVLNRRQQARLAAKHADLVDELLKATGQPPSDLPGDCTKPPASNDWITTGEAASRTGLSKAHLRRLCSENDLAENPAGFARWDGGWRIWPARLREYLHHHNRPRRRK